MGGVFRRQWIDWSPMMKPIAMENRPTPRRRLRRFGGSIAMSIVATALMAGCGTEEGSSVRADGADSSAEMV